MFLKNKKKSTLTPRFQNFCKSCAPDTREPVTFVSVTIQNLKFLIIIYSNSGIPNSGHPKIPLVTRSIVYASFMGKNCLFFCPAHFYPKNSIFCCVKIGQNEAKNIILDHLFSRPFQKTFSLELIFVSATEFNIFVLFFCYDFSFNFKFFYEFC